MPNCDCYGELILRGQALEANLHQLELQTALDQPFIINITLSTPLTPDFFEQQLHQEFLFKINCTNRTNYYFNGILTTFYLLPKTANNTQYRLTIAAPLMLTKNYIFPMIFNNYTTQELIHHLLTHKSLNHNANMLQKYLLKLHKTNKLKTYITSLLMHNESLFNFFQRLLKNHGLGYFFEFTHPDTPLIISDALSRFSTDLELAITPYTPEALTLEPYIEKLDLVNNAYLLHNIVITGSPTLTPQYPFNITLVTAPHALPYHFNHQQCTYASAEAQAQQISTAFQRQQYTLKLQGGGWLFASSKIHIKQHQKNSWIIHSSLITVTFDQHHPKRIHKIKTYAQAHDANRPYYAVPETCTYSSLIDHTTLCTANSAIDQQLIAVNQQGHYHARFTPAHISNIEQRPQASQLRILHSMHSTDHHSHMTAPTASNAVLLWPEDIMGKALVLGTSNNLKNTHLTHQDTAQNAYWQDDNLNKLAFINEGTFDRTRSTYRKSATLMHTPNYYLQKQNYLRLGDPINHDTQYSKYPHTPGIFLYTSGHYQEQHQGNSLTLIGTLTGNNNTRFVPASRQQNSLTPSQGNYAILISITAHKHQEDLTTTHVKLKHLQDTNTITKKLNALQHSQNYYADTTENIYLNQYHHYQGETIEKHYHDYTVKHCSQQKNFTTQGKKLLETHTEHTLNLHHQHNNFFTETQTHKVKHQELKIQELQQNFTHMHQQTNNVQTHIETAILKSIQAKITAHNFCHKGMLFIN
jgi:hypothetical protein